MTDPVLRLSAVRLVRDGTTLLVVTHDERLASESGRVVHMLDGRIVADDGSRPG